MTALFKFKGQTAHSAGAPWRGKSALDAVMLMGQGWEYKREHLEPAQRSHYVIKDGGDQPNVVPQTASIWFYLRERDYDRVMNMFGAARRMAQGAALMTDTQVDTVQMLLPSAVLPLAQVTSQRQREAELRRNLRENRTAIDKFKDAVDTGLIPTTRPNCAVMYSMCS